MTVDPPHNKGRRGHAIAIGCILLLAAGGVPAAVKAMLSTVSRTAPVSGLVKLPHAGSGFILQPGLVDCGPATTANFLKANGVAVRFEDVRNDFDVSPVGVTVDQIRAALARRRIKTGVVSFEAYRRRSGRIPGIVLRDHHFILVLPRANSSQYEIVDPWAGEELAPATYFSAKLPVLIRVNEVQVSRV